MSDFALADATGKSAGTGVGRLAGLFAGGEWKSRRAWLTERDDRNPFVTANILLVLERAGLAEALGPAPEAARERLSAYRDGHLAYHWPLQGGSSRMADAPPLWRHRFVEISPDADCTCLVQLARRDPDIDASIVAELEFYRADEVVFRLPRFQRGLPAAHGSYLTWFPPREQCLGRKVETVDAGVDANILWYLGTIGRLDAPGAAETTSFLAEVVRARRALEEPFRVSMYYPKPAVLLYLIARAAAWGEVPALLDLRQTLAAQLGQAPARSALEALCRAAGLALMGEPDGARDIPTPDGRGAFYVGPLLAWPLQRCAPLLGLAAHPMSHLRFSSEAFEWALWCSLQAAA